LRVEGWGLWSLTLEKLTRPLCRRVVRKTAWGDLRAVTARFLGSLPDSGLRVEGFGFKVEGLGFGVES